MTDRCVLAHARDLPDTFYDRRPSYRQLLPVQAIIRLIALPTRPSLPTRSPSVSPTIKPCGLPSFSTKIAITLLESIGSIELAGQLAGKIEAPEPTWLKPFAERLNIRVKPPQKIDEARRDPCNHCVIWTFFDGSELLLDPDPSLILNCDEDDIT
jgi:hypothetical protein